MNASCFGAVEDDVCLWLIGAETRRVAAWPVYVPHIYHKHKSRICSSHQLDGVDVKLTAASQELLICKWYQWCDVIWLNDELEADLTDVQWTCHSAGVVGAQWRVVLVSWLVSWLWFIDVDGVFPPCVFEWELVENFMLLSGWIVIIHNRITFVFYVCPTWFVTKCY